MRSGWRSPGQPESTSRASRAGVTIRVAAPPSTSHQKISSPPAAGTPHSAELRAKKMMSTKVAQVMGSSSFSRPGGWFFLRHHRDTAEPRRVAQGYDSLLLITSLYIYQGDRSFCFILRGGTH